MSPHPGKPRIRIAYFSPLPPAKSGIADYSDELLPYLAEHTDITLFTDNPHQVDAVIAKQFPIYPIDSYPEKRWQYDIPLYQMGNSAHHEALYQMFLRYPGLVVLHDYSLYHFISHRTVGADDFAGYMRELGYELGRPGIERARQDKMGIQTESLNEVPFNRRLLDLSLGFIVHSRYVQDLILARKGETAVTVIPQHMATSAAKSRRHQLSWPDKAIIFASVGQVTAAKQIEFALRAFKKIRQTIPNAYYLIIGEETGDVNLSNAINSLNLSDSVQHIGYVADKQEFAEWIYTVDIILNLRYPTVGETSATALRALAAGRPLILFDHGWYSELPDSVCIKTPPLDEDALIAVMHQLTQHPQKRRQLGEAGRQLIQNEHRPDRVAHAYSAFIRQQLSSLTGKYEN
ncbi:MAG: glycosyltransferase [Chloroflexi bacterium]|nr:glycosyltransferase [Chloroflexota bacterium]